MLAHEDLRTTPPQEYNRLRSGRPDVVAAAISPLQDGSKLEDLFKDLTSAQREAVAHIEGPLLILAGPGSGKTRVVTHRIANLLRHDVAASQILALTFTNKAADEMKRRVERLAPGQRVWISTFHRFCARLLREFAPIVGLQENFTIYDTADSLNTLKRAMERLDFDPEYYTPQQIIHAISQAKNNLVTAEQFQPRKGQPLDTIVAKVYKAYQERLLGSNAVDFDDLLMHVALLLRENPELRESLDSRYRYILVDEYQDTNLAQYAIVRALSINNPNLSVTGDPDQSIYGWRGANISNILEFDRDYPNAHIVRLEQNYRSTKRILRVAAQLISHNVQRKEKDLFTENDEGRPVRFVIYPNQKDEAEQIAGRIAAEIQSGQRRAADFAIFYRTNALSRWLETGLREYGIPYQIVNGVEFYQRQEIKDVLAYLILLNNPRDDEAFMRVVNTPPRGIGKTTLDRLGKHAARYGLTLFEAARESGLIEALSKRTAVGIAKFMAIMDKLSVVAILPVEEVLGHVLTESGYKQHLEQSPHDEDQDRLANIEELLTAAREFDMQNPGDGHLEEFLEQSRLVNDTDAWADEDDRVTMMTLHASKGLEFPVVFIVAVEQGLIPHERSRESPSQMEEERRLLFVGITRARQELQLSQARLRSFRGLEKFTIPSPFLMELPLAEMETVSGTWMPSQPSVDWEMDHSHDDFSHDDSASVQDHVHHDDDLVDAPTPGGSSPRGPRPGVSMTMQLRTAAEMASGGAQAQAAAEAESFSLGMVVRHPEYGLGKIVALSGSGVRRMATVSFATAGEKRFILHQSPLKPLVNGKS
jgi:DNA helicase-2/ATP-dependent DNA helicase PcrA